MIDSELQDWGCKRDGNDMIEYVNSIRAAERNIKATRECARGFLKKVQPVDHDSGEFPTFMLLVSLVMVVVGEVGSSRFPNKD